MVAWCYGASTKSVCTAPCRADSSRPPVVALYACWSAALEQLQSISAVQHWLACLVSQCPSCACHGGLVLRCFYKVCAYCAIPCGFVTAACCCTVRLLVGSPGTAAVHFNGATLVGVPSQPVPQLRLPWWPGVTVLLQSLCVLRHAVRIRHGRLLLHCTLVGRQPWNSCSPFQRCNIGWRA